MHGKIEKKNVFYILFTQFLKNKIQVNTFYMILFK